MLPGRPLHETPGTGEEQGQELRGTFRSGDSVAAARHARVQHHLVGVEVAELRELAGAQRALELFHDFLPRAIFARAGIARAPSAAYSWASRPAAARTLWRTSGGRRVSRPAVRTLPPTIPFQSASTSATRWVSDTGWISTASSPAPSSSPRSSSSSAKWTEAATP